MKKPELSELALYAEIAAAIAVVVSLIYVGRQVQENTAAIRSSTMQAVADSSDIALQNQAANEDLTRIRMAGDADISVLTELEATRAFGGPIRKLSVTSILPPEFALPGQITPVYLTPISSNSLNLASTRL